jgi:DNA-binding NtrC family response regulator
LDYHLKEENGSSAAKTLLSMKPELYILVYSGDDSRETLKNTWQSGAVGFVEKGASTEEFLKEVANWCLKFKETRQTIHLSRCLSENSQIISEIKLVGRSHSMVNVVEKVKKYAPKKDTVLILGETGTGKEKISRALHLASDSTFFAVNCASFNGSHELMESELFGHQRGAFTGATQDKKGVFEEAQGGTVFLDEVHTLDIKAQQKLLRVLQEKKIRPLGSSKEKAVSFRLIAATKPQIEEDVARGSFLPDLFERINVLRIHIPPLRERVEDIEPLVAYFAKKYEQETGEKKLFLQQTLKYLERYAWPRNVRELENTVRRLCTDCNGEVIKPEHLEAKFFAPAESRELNPSIHSGSLKSQYDDLLKKRVQESLSRSRSKRQTAKELGIPESSLRRMLKNWEVRSSPF